MSYIDCEKHQIKKDYLFCSNSRCKDRLVCKKCFHIDQDHIGHKYVHIKYFMEGDDHELRKIFSDTFIEIYNQSKDVNSFIKVFDGRINKYLDEKEE